MNIDKINISQDIKGFDILDIQERERQRIAGELHDSFVQNLTHLVHMIELSSMYIDEDIVRAKLEMEESIQFLKSTIDEIRNTIFNLRPMIFDDLGFIDCIDNLVDDIRSHFKDFEIVCDICDLKKEDFKNIDDEKCYLVLLTIYRVIQEAIINAVKHSNGSKVILNVENRGEKCLISIKDNGKGFSSENLYEKRDKHFGIPFMKEKIDLLNGNILIDTKPEKGTEIKIEIPLIWSGGK